MNNKTVLTIAGFDPSSGAGVTADLMVFAAHDLFGTSCITALTVQNTLGVAATHLIATDIVTATLNNLYADLPPSGIKIGMLGSASNVRATARFLALIRQNTPVIVVLDPVLKSSSGKDLSDEEGLRAMQEDLLPHVDWITPNRSELSTLTSFDPASPYLAKAALELQRSFSKLTVVLTGGDLEPPLDLLFEPGLPARVFEGHHIQTSSSHGTGCAFSSALLSNLVNGLDPPSAVQAAKDYVSKAMRTATPLGSGYGPIHHLWPLRSSSFPS